MIISIAAMTKKGRIIGKGNKLPWNIPEEFSLFKRLIGDSTVVMGRSTYESIGRPMPNRHNIVISRTMQPAKGIDVCKSIEEGLEKAKSYNKTIFILGGAQIYKQTLDIVDKLYLSFIRKEYGGDTRFPDFDENDWIIEKREDHKEFEFVIYKRKNN